MLRGCLRSASCVAPEGNKVTWCAKEVISVPPWEHRTQTSLPWLSQNSILKQVISNSTFWLLLNTIPLAWGGNKSQIKEALICLFFFFFFLLHNTDNTLFINYTFSLKKKTADTGEKRQKIKRMDFVYYYFKILFRDTK